ncbi:MAG: glutathione S-transferase family protein [Proteobacteria bacterium]|nr:glutathione S-transferase family protein [Pseudomonadota bacterium]
MLKLFYNPGSIALASHLLLEEIGCDYEAVHLNYAIMEHTKPEYLAINPKGRVPSLITEKGILTETPAILLYLAQRFPESDFAAPEDIYELAELQAVTSYLCSTVHVNHAHRMRGYRWVEADDETSLAAMQRKVQSNMEECFALIEKEVFKGPWVMGDKISIADPYLFVFSFWMEGDNVNPADFPKLLDHRNRILDRPAAKKVVPLHQP